MYEFYFVFLFFELYEHTLDVILIHNVVCYLLAWWLAVACTADA